MKYSGQKKLFFLKFGTKLQLSGFCEHCTWISCWIDALYIHQDLSRLFLGHTQFLPQFQTAFDWHVPQDDVQCGRFEQRALFSVQHLEFAGHRRRWCIGWPRFKYWFASCSWSSVKAIFPHWNCTQQCTWRCLLLDFHNEAALAPISTL